MKRVGLYLHVPYCQTKCGYCDFYSVPLRGRPTGPLVRSLIKELESRTGGLGLSPRTVFVGGGTPTVLPPDELRTLFAALRDAVGPQGCEEFTVEANPATLNDEKMAILTAAGVDRVSMGAQSWHAAELAALERLHSPQDIAASVAVARRHGIARLNLDLIFGIGGQTLATWADSLRRTIDLGADHVSCYALTYEQATRLSALLNRGRIVPCDEGLEADMYLLAIDTLAQHGYEQYEISSFARPGQRCLHNLIYWRNEPCIGIGPSAAGYTDGVRYKNVADVNAYVRGLDRDGHAVAESERVTGAALAGETMMMQLRLNEGIDTRAFTWCTGIDPHEAFGNNLARHAQAGLIEVTSDRIALTRRGRLLADAVISDLYAEVHEWFERAHTESAPDRHCGHQS